jgi:hypothetical protein
MVHLKAVESMMRLKVVCNMSLACSEVLVISIYAIVVTVVGGCSALAGL